jgi:hypothetical protein
MEKYVQSTEESLSFKICETRLINPKRSESTKTDACHR